MCLDKDCACTRSPKVENESQFQSQSQVGVIIVQDVCCEVERNL